MPGERDCIHNISELLDNARILVQLRQVYVEAGSRKQEAGSRKQEAGSRKEEAGSRKQEAGKQEAGSRKEEGGSGRGTGVEAWRGREGSGVYHVSTDVQLRGVWYLTVQCSCWVVGGVGWFIVLLCLRCVFGVFGMFLHLRVCPVESGRAAPRLSPSALPSQVLVGSQGYPRR